MTQFMGPTYVYCCLRHLNDRFKCKYFVLFPSCFVSVRHFVNISSGFVLYISLSRLNNHLAFQIVRQLPSICLVKQQMKHMFFASMCSSEVSKRMCDKAICHKVNTCVCVNIINTQVLR